MRVDDHLDAIVAAATRDWRAPGAAGGAIALFTGDRITRAWCLGLADIESARGWTLDTPTRLASLSKHVTAAAVFAQGLAGRLGTWLPELQPALADATLDRALTMTSGIPDLGETLGLAGISTTLSLDAERLHALACRIAHLNFPPGAEISYSNTNFRLAQRAVERAAAMPLARWLDAAFFKPLGLGSFALPDDQAECVPGLAQGYWHAGGLARRGAYGLHYSGSGGMVASARDFVRWLDALLRGAGPLAGMLARLAVPGCLADGRAVGYAQGLMLHRLGGQDLIGHAGSLPGHKNHFLLDPRTGAGVLVFSNREETAAQTLALDLFAAAQGLDRRRAAPTAMPTGLFVDPATGDTLDLAQGPGGASAAFLGTAEALHVAPEDGWLASESPHLPIRIGPAAPEATRLTASIGGAAARLWLRADAVADPAHAGRFACAALDVTHAILADGAGLALRWGGGPVPAAAQRLRPGLAGSYAAATPPVGPWRQMPALRLTGEGFVLSSNRSRRWCFARL